MVKFYDLYENLLEVKDYKKFEIISIYMPQKLLDDIYKQQEHDLKEQERRDQGIKDFLNKNMIENSPEFWENVGKE